MITDKKIKFIKNMGMFKKNGTKGNLIIIYKIIYPKQLCKKEGLLNYLKMTYFKRDPISKLVITHNHH